MKTKLIATVFLLFSFGSTRAQDHEHSHHEHSRNEIGFSTGALYGFGHKEWGAGVHLHYYRTLKPDSKWSFGGGIEQAWIDGTHFNVGAGIKYQLLDRLSVSLFPGASFVSHHETDARESSEAVFTLHSELVYDIFHWDKYHFFWGGWPTIPGKRTTGTPCLAFTRPGVFKVVIQRIQFEINARD